jgi:hypothetical protein
MSRQQGHSAEIYRHPTWTTFDKDRHPLLIMAIQAGGSGWEGNWTSASTEEATWSFRELTEHESAIHVEIPILGSTHNCRTNQPTSSPTTTTISMC